MSQPAIPSRLILLYLLDWHRPRAAERTALSEFAWSEREERPRGSSFPETGGQALPAHSGAGKESTEGSGGGACAVALGHAVRGRPKASAPGASLSLSSPPAQRSWGRRSRVPPACQDSARADGPPFPPLLQSWIGAAVLCRGPRAAPPRLPVTASQGTVRVWDSAAGSRGSAYPLFFLEP